MDIPEAIVGHGAAFTVYLAVDIRPVQNFNSGQTMFYIKHTMHQSVIIIMGRYADAGL